MCGQLRTVSFGSKVCALGEDVSGDVCWRERWWGNVRAWPGIRSIKAG